MTAQKKYSIHENVTIEPYNFGELRGASNKEHKVTDFVIQDFTNAQNSKKVDPKTIRQERVNADQVGFKVSPIVKEHRGMVKQEQEDFERKVSEEVERRLSLIKDEAFQEGLNAGTEQGHQEAYQEALKGYAEKLQELETYLAEAFQYKADLFKAQREEVYKMIKLLVKWVLLKEVKNDQYIRDLFEKLIMELQTKTNLLVKVNAANFEKMPEVIELTQQRLGPLTNVRLEIEPDMNLPGLIIESDNGIVDGSLEAQFANLDKLFHSVGIGLEDK